MRRLIAAFLSVLVGCQAITDQQTQNRKERDRELILQGRDTEWYSPHDPAVWNNSSDIPESSIQRVLH